MSFSFLNIDTLISDPMLLIGAALCLIGVLVFLISLWKLIRFRDKNSFSIPTEATQNEVSLPASVEQVQTTVDEVTPEQKTNEPAAAVAPVADVQAPVAEPIVSIPVPAAVNGDQTMILPAGVADIQAEMNIIVTQVKQLNKKISDFEDSLEEMAKQFNAKLEVNELKEVPMSPQDFTQKLLKLAEHVIVLEKEVAKMKVSGGKMPIMPL